MHLLVYFFNIFFKYFFSTFAYNEGKILTVLYVEDSTVLYVEYTTVHYVEDSETVLYVEDS